MERLGNQSGRIARVQWRAYSMTLQITPAGLLDLAPASAMPDLRIEVADTSPFAIAQSAMPWRQADDSDRW